MYEKFGDVKPHPRHLEMKNTLVVHVMLVSALIATIRRSKESTIDLKRIRVEETRNRIGYTHPTSTTVCNTILLLPQRGYTPPS